MSEQHEMDQLIDVTKVTLIDAFAAFVGMLNDRNYADASVAAHSLAVGLSMYSKGLAGEALVRRIEGLDNPAE